MAEQANPAPPPVPVISSRAPRVAPIAIWSLLLAILFFLGGWLVTAVPAVICGHIAYSKIRRSGGALVGEGIAIAALIIGYIGVALGLLGVPLVVGMIKSDLERHRQLLNAKQELGSPDGKLKVTTSGMWTKMPGLNKQATMQIAYKANAMYLMVITDPKSTVPNMTLDEHHQLTRDHMLQKMKNPSITQPVSVTIDNHPGLQDELSGTDNGASVVFLHTTVDDGDNFHQILAWTPKSRWVKQKSELREVTNSFRSEK
jgi:hypothetical protein